MPTKGTFNISEPLKVPKIPVDWASYYFGLKFLIKSSETSKTALKPDFLGKIDKKYKWLIMNF